MKIKDLFNLEKAISKKQKELEKIRIELEETKKNLKDLQEEQAFIEGMIDYNENSMNDNSELLEININSTYRFRYNGIFQFVTPTISRGCIELTNILNGNIFRIYEDEVEKLELLVNLYPEILTYIDGKIPLTLLQKLYYESNHIDSKVLKKAKINE